MNNIMFPVFFTQGVSTYLNPCLFSSVDFLISISLSVMAILYRRLLRFAMTWTISYSWQWTGHSQCSFPVAHLAMIRGRVDTYVV